jgi:hypothetical protein
MPRLKNTTPKYRHHKASGQAIVTLDGQDFYLGPHGSRPSRREYERIVGEWLQNGRSLSSDPHAITVAELINAYRKYAETYYVKRGKQTDEVKGIKAAAPIVKEGGTIILVAECVDGMGSEEFAGMVADFTTPDEFCSSSGSL